MKIVEINKDVEKSDEGKKPPIYVVLAGAFYRIGHCLCVCSSFEIIFEALDSL